MLILHEGELLHTDSSTEILEHYGVQGMKWGKQIKTKGFKNKVDNYGQYRRDVSDMNKKYSGRKGY